MTNDINPQTISVARQSRGLTQTQLAHQLSITQSNLSKMESGFLGVDPDILTRLSQALDYPVDFFHQTEPVYGLGGNILYHRRRKSLTKRELDRIHAQVHIRRVHLTKLLNNVEIGPNKIEHCDLDEYDRDIQAIAHVTRAHWRLPPGPIQNLSNAIESMGGIIIRCDFGTRLLDAISQAVPGLPPLFFLNTEVPVDRARFTLAHELAHVIMHTGVPYPSIEDEANTFAAELLLPEEEIRPTLTALTLPKLAALKQYWKVSMSAILMRAEQLGKISERQARYLWYQMGKLGYRTREPEVGLPPEVPTVFQNMIEVHRTALNYTVSQLSHLLALHEHELRSVYLGPMFGDTAVLRPNIRLV
jgi:Zn-dependent peptidase ImmA (M78 family)/transcriptional regulator with XRE-family HTH domain